MSDLHQGADVSDRTREDLEAELADLKLHMHPANHQAWDEWKERERLLKERVHALEEFIKEYTAHQGWRCSHIDRWPWDGSSALSAGYASPEEPECPCGLVGDLRRLGLPGSIAEESGVAG